MRDRVLMTDTRTEAFWPAYYALEQHGVAHAQIRNHMAGLIVDKLMDLRQRHGMGLMLEISQSGTDHAVVGEVMAEKPRLFTASMPAVREAVKAAARVLARG